MNHLLGQKLSITSRKPQTTRHRIHGILSNDEMQAVFVDTPGIHRNEVRAINERMNKAAVSALVDVDLVLFVVDENDKMVGTLTDGDSRRALIAGVSVNDSIEKVMHKNFNFLRRGVDDDVQHLHEQKLKKMKIKKTNILKCLLICS